MRKKKGSSWLQEWWNTLGYLSVRDPVPVNVSYFFHFSDDPNASTGVKRAASLLVSTARFRRLVLSGDLTPETIGRGKTELCGVAWKYMFNACRVPHRGQDTYHLHDPSLHRHVVVLRRGNFYTFDFVDDSHNPLPQGIIEARLQQVVAIEDGRERLGVGFGVCTAGEGQVADDRDRLIRLDPKVKAGLEVIESAAVVVCMDITEPVSTGCGSVGFWHGGEGGGSNRWFDKPVEIIVTDNGKAGLLGEHSMMDGMPMVRFADCLVRNKYKDTMMQAPLDVTYIEELRGGVRDVFEDVGDGKFDCQEVAEMVAVGTNAFNKLVGDQELTANTFRGFGSREMKRAKMSPDAFVQVVIQLATTRLFGKSVGTYEASQVRVFKHGRTETTRSCSLETVELCQAMGMRNDGRGESCDVARKRRMGLFRKAAEGHVRYLKLAAKGQGVDRHMFGLKMLLKPREKVPALFNNPLFAASKTWRVSTSHLTHPEFDNWGWGEVVPDGVGIAYSIHPDRCVFNVTARRETNYSRRLSHLLDEALMEVW
eukprot:CAMPEP_0118647398 /NCGR_PEP_ID=MMETSP0785-20121206/8583_1 /TAXON_ID=91992 /ORGANISM="Bolidomonas pacifica, Strain CCMP 1866" /LENGTH=537 /DNA_ID=CAMNT_0006539485 /DNA_START=242 /DNA_END=1853 /DNA_ORIENTATION=-